MIEFKYLICTSYGKICYPVPISIELLFHEKTSALSLVARELYPGEEILIGSVQKKILYIYKIDNNKLEQIYGEPIIEIDSIELVSEYIDKVNYTKKFVKGILETLSITELITNLQDLINAENELIKYYLMSKSESKIEKKRIRSILFKNVKNSKISEKIYQVINNKEYEFFKTVPIIVKVNFDDLTVQKEHESGILG